MLIKNNSSHPIKDPLQQNDEPVISLQKHWGWIFVKIPEKHYQYSSRAFHPVEHIQLAEASACICS